jgi:hypothetical protein
MRLAAKVTLSGAFLYQHLVTAELRAEGLRIVVRN